MRRVPRLGAEGDEEPPASAAPSAGAADVAAEAHEDDLGPHVESVIRIIDLAGSERNRDVLLHDAARMREAKDVNWSLACLRDCVRASARRASGANCHVNFRGSKLTMLLRDCLESGGASTWITHVAPTSAHLAATRGALSFTSDLLTLEAAKAAQPRPAGSAVPQRWSKARVAAWLRSVEEGRFEHLAESLAWLDGPTLSQEWLRDLVARAGASGVPEGDMEAIYEAFRALSLEARRRGEAQPGSSRGQAKALAPPARLQQVGGV